MSTKKWKIILDTDNGRIEGAYNILKHIYREYWNTTAQGWDVVVYVTEVHPQKREVVLAHGMETRNTWYTWTRDYHSPHTIVWRFNPRNLHPDEDEPEDKDDLEEFIEFYTDYYAQDDEEEFERQVMETVREICKWEGWTFEVIA